MARNQNIVCVSLLVFNVLFSAYCKIHSKSVGDISLFQRPNVGLHTDERLYRRKRESDTNTTSHERKHTDFIHSETSNQTLSSKSFSLHGVDDNQALVHWTGVNNDIVFVLTRGYHDDAIQSSTLWRSADYGETYTKVDLPTNFTVNHFHTSKVDKNKVLLSDISHQLLYITVDAGETWTSIQLQFPPYRVLLHPSDPNMVLAYSLREMKLYVSEDFGRTWTLLKERVSERFFWAVMGQDLDVNTVHMEIQDPMGPVSYQACSAPSGRKVQTDESIGTIDFYSLVVENEYIFVQKSVEDNTSLYVSYRRGPFKKAFFPVDLHPLDFMIVDSTDHQVLIAVDHMEDITNLYLSDVTGQFYVTSVERVVGLRYPGKFDVDIVKMDGLPGIYIVNQFKSMKSIYSLQTMITFDKGDNWQYLEAPEGTRHQCQDQTPCHLHLHIGNTNQFLQIPMAVSVPEAPGLILAHGTVGEFLDFHSDVYISRNGGLTWKQAPFQGNHFLNIMDQGSALSAVSADAGTTNQVFFSCTEGETWISHNFSEVPVAVNGVVNEPGVKSLISSMFGHVNTSQGWIMIKMDFSSVLKRMCDEDDLEIWNPAANIKVNGTGCLMGETLMYERRKQLSQCYLGKEYLRTHSRIPCSCGREDFECDFGYELAADKTTCVKSDWLDENKLPAPRCVNGKYNKTSGYRKVASSRCEGGQLDPYQRVETDCPLLAPRGLKIVSDMEYVPRGSNVTFTLTQIAGSTEETTYTWTFGNTSTPVSILGLQNAVVMTRSFHAIDSYDITVTALNSKGSAKAVLKINVEDELKGVLVEIPWGARTGTPSYFNVTVLSSDNNTKYGGEKSLQFVWKFENKNTGVDSLLTWQNVLQQKFTHPGEYILTLVVFNPISSVFYTQPVEVYDDITTVRLHFSSQINNYNSSSLNVRQALAEILCHNIAEILEVRRSRIIMTVQPYMPVVGDVTVLPAKPNSNESETYEILKAVLIQKNATKVKMKKKIMERVQESKLSIQGNLKRFQVVHMLIKQAKEQYLSFPLFTYDDIVVITDAGILDLNSGQESETIPPAPVNDSTVQNETVTVQQGHSQHNLVAVYISVPVLIGVLVIAVLVILYYRKKSTRNRKYQPIVKHRHRTHFDSTCSCGDDDVGLGLEDPEFTIIPDSEYRDNEATLVILNEPRDRNVEVC